MAKITGIPSTLSIDNGAGVSKVITNDVTSVSFSTPRDSWEVTGLDKTAVERLVGLVDFTGEISGEFNAAADMSHAVLSTACSTSQVRTLVIQLGSGVAATMTAEVYVTDYTISRDEKGRLTWKAPFVNAGLTTPTWS